MIATQNCPDTISAPEAAIESNADADSGKLARALPHFPWRERWRCALRGVTWRSMVAAVRHAISKGQLFDLPAQIAYWSVLAIFPLAIVVLSLLSYIPYEGLNVRLMAFLYTVMPSDAANLVGGVLHDVVGKQHGALLVLALVGAWWTASGGIGALMTAMNEALHVEETRSYWKTKGIALGLTAAATIFAMFAVATVAVGSVIGQRVMDAVGWGHPVGWVYAIFRMVIIVVAMMAISGMCYWLLPNAPRRGRFFVPGMVVATLAWVIVSLGFSFYVARFAGYSKTYGTVGAAIILMTWFYLVGLVLLIGAVLNAHLDETFAATAKNFQWRRRWRASHR